MFKHITAKLGSMKKEVDWIVYPAYSQAPNLVNIQSDHRVAQVDLEAKNALLTKHYPNGAYIVYLNDFLNTKRVPVSDEIIIEIKKHQQNSKIERSPVTDRLVNGR